MIYNNTNTSFITYNDGRVMIYDDGDSDNEIYKYNDGCADVMIYENNSSNFIT